MKAIIFAKMIYTRSARRPCCSPAPRSEDYRAATVQGFPCVGSGGFHPRSEEGCKSGDPALSRSRSRSAPWR
eukprot:13451290-Alexandrium_andersonii.AAC.1